MGAGALNRVHRRLLRRPFLPCYPGAMAYAASMGWVAGSALGFLLVATLPSPAPADLAPEVPGEIERLAKPFDPHWIWVTDLFLERVALVDLDSGRFLGLVNSGYGPALALFPKSRSEMYLPATYFSRRFRGERTDVLEVWDIETLSFVAEIELPSKRAIDSFALGHAALTDDDRFAAVLNWTPATSLSIVDVERRTLAGEVPIPGCSLAFAAGPRRLLSLCGDGAALAVHLDNDGALSDVRRSVPFFDPATDPVTEKAVRFRDQWLFASFAGMIHAVDVSGPDLAFPLPWSLLSDADRADAWQVGGLQYLAVHEPSGRLYALVHRGGPDGHKEPGEEVWVYDIERRERVARIPLRHPGLAIYGEVIDIGNDWIWPFNGLFDWFLDSVVPPLVTHIQVTRDDEPLLFTASQFTGSIGVYDARSGEMIRRVQPTGWTSETLYAPFGAH